MTLNRLLIKKPLISERATDLQSQDKYIFLVDIRTNKREVKRLIEEIYKIHVIQVNIIRNAKKSKSYKKAVVTLKKGETIEAAAR